MKTIKITLYLFIVLCAGMTFFIAGTADAQSVAIEAPTESTLECGDVTFTWTGIQVTEWWLWVGPCDDPAYGGCGDDYLNSGSLGTAVSYTVSGSVFPTEGGSAVHVRLWYKSGGVWDSITKQYVTNVGCEGTPKITEVHRDPDGRSIHIEGVNINESLTVTLGDYMDPLNCNPNLSIDCQLPEDIAPGDYRLRVQTDDGKYDEYDLTIAVDLTDALCDLASATGNSLPAVCPTDCAVGPWDAWSSCSQVCGGGERTRTRTVLTEPTNGGAPCPVLEQTQDCNTQPCP